MLFLLIPAFIALLIYWANYRLKRGKWLKTLHENISSDQRLQKVCSFLETETDQQKISNYVKQQKSELLYYFDYFEFIKFLVVQRNLSENEFKSLTGKYIKCLSNHNEVLNFITNNNYLWLISILQIQPSVISKHSIYED